MRSPSRGLLICTVLRLIAGGLYRVIYVDERRESERQVLI